jgi:hypothetical protein
MCTERFFCHDGPLLAHLPSDSMGEWWNVVNRTIIATTLFFGMLLTAPADSAPYTEQGRQGEALYIRSGACPNEGLRKLTSSLFHEKQYAACAIKAAVKLHEQYQVTAGPCALSMFFIPKS